MITPVYAKLTHKTSQYNRHLKECFTESDTGERIFCQSKHVKGHMMKDCLLRTHTFVTVHYVIELYLSGLTGLRPIGRTC